MKRYHVRKIILKNKKYTEQRNKVTVLACLIFFCLQGTGPAGDEAGAGGCPLLSLLPLSPLPRRVLLRFFLHQMRP